MWTLPVIHPAATFRDGEQLGPLIAHVEGFVRRLHKGFGPRPTLSVDPSYTALEQLLQLCYQKKLPLSIDVESKREYALLAKYATLRNIGVGVDYGEGIGLSWFYPLPAEVRVELKRAFADPNLAKLFVNGWAYDIPILKRFGFEVKGPVHDVRDAARALNSTARVGLGPQAAIHLTCGPWKAEATEDDGDEKGFVDASRISRAKVGQYNAEDTVRAAQIWTHQRREIFHEDPDDKPRRVKLYNQQLRLAHAAARMQVRGFPVDAKERAKLAGELLVLGERRLAKVRRLVRSRAPDFRVGPGGVNENDLRALLFEQCAKKGIKSFGLPVPMSPKAWTETGMVAVNKDALLLLWTMDNVPDEVKEIIYACWQADAPYKAFSTYIESAKVDGAIGPVPWLSGYRLIHPKHNSCGTETGRWSCKNPNLYNLPEAQDEDAGSLRGDMPNLRRMYGCPPGWVFVHRDWKALELEMMATVTGDVPLRRALDAGDVHTATVREWFNKPEPEPVPRMIRRQAKVVRFASQYGAGLEQVYLKVLEQMQDASFDDVRNLFELFPEKHPGIAKHWVDSKAFAEKTGYSETPVMKRRRYYPPGEDIEVTMTSNYDIQGGAADLANGTLVGDRESDYPKGLEAQLEKHFPESWIAMFCYDAFDIVCRRENAKDVAELMDECMSREVGILGTKKRFKSDLKVARNWGDT